MEVSMSQPIIEALQGFAEAHPEQAQEIIAKLSDKWDTLTDDQKNAVLEKAGELKDKVANMSLEERQGIADQISSLF
jgi:hypothetical protein